MRECLRECFQDEHLEEEGREGSWAVVVTSSKEFCAWKLSQAGERKQEFLIPELSKVYGMSQRGPGTLGTVAFLSQVTR